MAEETTGKNLKLTLTLLSILVIIGGVFAFIFTVNARADSALERALENRESIELIQKSINSIDVRLASIDVKLDSNCEKIIEIKQDINEIKKTIR